MKPMLCRAATIEEGRELMKVGEWIVEEKYDGIRAYIQGGKLYDRRGKEITQKFPEFVGLSDIMHVVDGEIVCDTFSEVQSRIHTKDKFYIGVLAKKSPAVFMAFDVVMPLPLWARKEMLSRFDGVYDWLRVVQSGKDLDAWWVDTAEREGVVMKDLNGKYEKGVRSDSCRKIKHFIEVEVVFTKCEEHNKGVRLETDEGRSVNVNGVQANEVFALFKRQGFVRCEVQYLPQLESGAWRFPSFRGVCEVQVR